MAEQLRDFIESGGGDLGASPTTFWWFDNTVTVSLHF